MPANEGIINSVSELVGFLNDNGFQVPAGKCTEFIQIFNKGCLNITLKDDVLGVMRTCFCSTPSQVEMIESLVDVFVQSREDVQVTDRKNDLKITKSSIETLKQQEQRARREKQKKLEDMAKNHKFSVKSTKSEIKAMRALGKKPGREIADMLADGLEKQDWRAFLSDYPFENDIKREEDKAKAECEKSLFNGDTARFKGEKALAELLKRTSSTIWNKEKRKVLELMWSDSLKEDEQKLEELSKERSKLEKKARAIQDEIDKALQSSQEAQKTIEKLTAKNHRDAFVGQNGAVKCSGNGELDKSPLFNKKFDKLTDNEKAEIHQYIKENALKFKTRMARRIKCENRRDIDMQETIAMACKTMGRPMNLAYQRPQANKANIVLVLDISGSCSNASEMMISFMHIFQEVFPRGCKTFAFVNTLYDISEIMKTDDVKKSISMIKNTIPVKGVYSDYYKPLETLWTEHHQDINSDSIVIFIGDARNNKNDTGEEYLKNICRRAKKSFWLNTEENSKWAAGDSIADVYSKYSKMFECISPLQLLNFLLEV